MKKLLDKIKSAFSGVQTKAEDFVKDESGDTNFISIAIILIVVIVIAVVFITFSDTIKTKFDAATGDLLGRLKY